MGRDRRSELNGYIGPNIGITPRTKIRKALRIFKLCMDGCLHLFCIMAIQVQGDTSTINSTLDHQLRERDVALWVLKEHLRVAQEKMKKSVDRKRRDVEFSGG